MMLEVQVDKVERAEKKVVPVNEYLRFVDSYKLFNGSLEKLLESLPVSEFGIMESMFAHIPGPDRQLLKQKGYYPYSTRATGQSFRRGCCRLSADGRVRWKTEKYQSMSPN